MEWKISTCPLAACFARFLALLLDLPEPVGGRPSTATCSGLPVHRGAAILSPMGTKSRETIYGASVRAAAERAAEARKAADQFACVALRKRHCWAFRGPAQPSPTLGDERSTPGLCYLRSEMPWLQHRTRHGAVPLHRGTVNKLHKLFQ